MRNSGHQPRFIKSILIGGILRFEVKLKNSLLCKADPKYRPIHQPSGKNVKRMRKKVMAKSNWFKDKSDEEQPEDVGANRYKTGSKTESKEATKEILMESRKIATSSIMFVQSTKAGILVNNLKKGEIVMSELTGFKVNYSEAGGTPLGNMFNVDLGKGLHCGRDYCPPCDTSEEGKRAPCRSRSVLYETQCSLCNPASHSEDHQKEDVQPTGSRSRSGVYIGETSRSLNERSIEHLADARSFHPGSHIVKHWMEMHPDLNRIPPFKFKVRKDSKIVYPDRSQKQ